MAKAKGQKGKKKQQRVANAKPRRMFQQFLDSQAIAYRNLLLDPCNGDLVHPIYAGGTGGILCRFTSTAFYGAGPTDTGFIFHWTPGAMTTSLNELVITGYALPTTPVVAFTAPLAAGRDFIPNNAMCYRCVSACATMTYTGSELGRAGSIWYGQTIGNMVNAGSSYIGVDMPKSLNRNIRTPDQSVDVLWRPGTTDEEWVDPNRALADDPLMRNDKGAITIVGSGLPVGVGMQIRMTAVFEYQPKYNTGMTVATNARSKTNNTLTQVLNSIPDAHWSRMGSAAQSIGASILRNAGMHVVNNAFRAGRFQGQRIEL